LILVAVFMLAVGVLWLASSPIPFPILAQPMHPPLFAKPRHLAGKERERFRASLSRSPNADKSSARCRVGLAHLGVYLGVSKPDHPELLRN
jgi:hypothetical protein